MCIIIIIIIIINGKHCWNYFNATTCQPLWLSKAWRLNCGHVCAFGRVDEAVSGGKPPVIKGVVGLLSWHGSHFWVCITFCKVRHGDSVTKPDYNYYYYYWMHVCIHCRGYNLLIEPYDRVMQLNWLHFCGICQQIPLKLWPNTA